MSSHSHRHFRIDTDDYIWHTHDHECSGPAADFNRLHHHAPVEHDRFTHDELNVIDRVVTREEMWRQREESSE